MASVVGTYARAFADVAMIPGNQLDPARALQELHNIEALLEENGQLRRVMENPSIPGEQKRAVLDAITARMGTTKQVRNFVAVLTDHRRLPAVQRNPEASGAGIKRPSGIRRSASKHRAPVERSRKANAGIRNHKNDRQKSESKIRRRFHAIRRSGNPGRQHDL